jgi:hypothetical protein
MLLEAAVVSVLSAATGPAIDLQWPDATCPDRRQIVRALATVGVQVDSGAPATVVAERGWGTWNLVLTWGMRRALREVQQLDSCDAEAATLAAVVERFVRPVWLWLERQAQAQRAAPSTPTAAPVAAAKSVPRVATRTDVPPSPEPPAPADARSFVAPPPPVPEPIPAPVLPPLPGPSPPAGIAQPLTAPEPGLRRWWIAADGTGSTDWSGRYSAGFETAIRWLLLERLAVAAHLGWETHYLVPVSPGQLVVEHLRAALSVEGSPIGHGLWVDGLVLLQGLTAYTRGYALDDAAQRLNPAVGLSLAWRGSVGPLGFELGVRQLLFLVVQQFRIDDRPVLTLPRSTTSAYLGLAYGI